MYKSALEHCCGHRTILIEQINRRVQAQYFIGQPS